MSKTGIFSFVLALIIPIANAATVELISGVGEAFHVSAQGDSRGPSFSADGRFILFSSDASDVSSAPAGPHMNVFIRDRSTGDVRLISAAPAGQVANGASAGAQISTNNQFVVFQSLASNFVLGDTNGWMDIFLRDMSAGTTTLVSHNSAGAVGDGASEFPELSPDGEWVVFQSASANLVAGDTNSLNDLFAWKRSDGSLRLVSGAFTGTTLNAEVGLFSLTPDGHSVLFSAAGTNLVVPNRKSVGDVYLHDLESGTTRWISSTVTNLPGYATASTANPVMSRNGRYVFVTVPASATISVGAVCRIDLTDDSAILVGQGGGTVEDFYGPSVSDDGEAAAYIKDSKVYYWKSSAAAPVQIDVSPGQTLIGNSDTPVISADGAQVAYMSASVGIVDGVGNGAPQLYVYDDATGQTKLVTHNAAGAATFGNDGAFPVFSPDGTTLLFESESAELVSGDNNQRADVFSYDLATGAISLLSVSKTLAPSATVVGTSNVGRDGVSWDGRFVLFRSLARLNSKDTNASWDLYVFDRAAKTNILVTAGPDGYSLPNVSFGTAILTRDGTKVFFQGVSPGLAGPDDKGGMYMRDLQTGALTNLGVGALQTVSGNGQFVFYGFATDLRRLNLEDGTVAAVTLPSAVASMSVSEDGQVAAYRFGTSLQVALRDYRNAATFTLGPIGTGPSALSDDGTFLVYGRGTTLAVTNLLTGETNGFGPFALTTQLSMSANARIIAFQTKSATNGGPTEIWFLDRSTGVARMISHAAGSANSGNGAADTPVVSADGAFIAFESWASDLVANDNNNFKDVFVYDVQADKLSVVSVAAGGATANSMSLNPTFSGDGSLLAFSSFASDLVGGDLNGSADVFAMELQRTAIADSDGDGLDDAWELATFSSLQYGANDDPDGDGATNAQEFRAGTQANSAASVFKILTLEPRTDGLNRLVWRASAGRRYRIQFKPNLQAADWTAVGNDVDATTTGDTSIDIPAVGEGYYRLQLVE